MTDSTNSTGVAPERLSWWDTRLHQLFSLAVLAYLTATWVAADSVTFALGVLVYVVSIPVLLGFYVLARRSGARTPVPLWVLVVVLLSCSLAWAGGTFVFTDSSWAPIAELALLVAAFVALGWNTLGGQ